MFWWQKHEPNLADAVCQVKVSAGNSCRLNWGTQPAKGNVMNKLISGISRFFREEEGASAVEYGVLVALIAVAVIVTVAAVGQQLNAVFEQIRTCLADPANCAAGAEN